MSLARLKQLHRERAYEARNAGVCIDCQGTCGRRAKRCLECHNKRSLWLVHRNREQWRTWAMTGTCVECAGACHRNAERCHPCACKRRGSRLCLDCGQRAAKYTNGLCKPCYGAWKREIVIAYREPGEQREPR